MNFLTMGDNNYFRTISISVSKVMDFYPEANFYVYDIGLEKHQVEELNTKSNVTVVNWTEEANIELSITQKMRVQIERVLKNLPAYDVFENLIKKYDSEDYLKGGLSYESKRRREHIYVQEPKVMLDCAKRTEGPVYYIDGDAFLVHQLGEEILDGDFDVGVTLRPKEEIEAARQRGDFHVLNLGVLFFNCSSEKTMYFIKEWLNVIRNTTGVLKDQTALTKLISRENDNIFTEYGNEGRVYANGEEFKVKIFPCQRYNYYWIEKGFNVEENRILHFKSGRYKEPEYQNILDKFESSS